MLDQVKKKGQSAEVSNKNKANKGADSDNSEASANTFMMSFCCWTAATLPAGLFYYV